MAAIDRIVEHRYAVDNTITSTREQLALMASSSLPTNAKYNTIMRNQLDRLPRSELACSDELYMCITCPRLHTRHFVMIGGPI
jgi:hypothetical protein